MFLEDSLYLRATVIEIDPSGREDGANRPLYVDLSILFAVELVVLSVIHLLQVVSSQK